jgi:hypothetical protein
MRCGREPMVVAPPGSNPISPLTMFKTAACAAEAHVFVDGRTELEREEDCRIYMPAMAGVELLSDAHVKAAHPQRGDF